MPIGGNEDFNFAATNSKGMLGLRRCHTGRGPFCATGVDNAIMEPLVGLEQSEKRFH